MVGGPGYDVERPSARYAVSILFSRECRGWAFEAMRWHRIVQRCAEIEVKIAFIIAQKEIM